MNTQRASGPPGFPFFVAATLWTRDHLAISLSDERAVVLTHGLLISLSALLIFWSAARRHSTIGAVAFGCVFAFHPAILIIAANVSYPMLSIALMIAAIIALAMALRAKYHQAFWALLAGIVWGMATLVRPLSLILPPFVLVLAYWEYGRVFWRRTLRFSGLFTLGMILAIAPVTWRNYRVSGRLIAINAQAGFSFWGVSLEQAYTANSNPNWVQLWQTQGVAIYKRVTGLPEYSLKGFYADVLSLNDAFAAEARRNIAANPGIYLRNVGRNFLRYNLDTLDWWIRRYRGNPLNPTYTFRGNTDFAAIFSVALTILALIGMIRGIFQGETLARVLVIIYAMLCIATCIGFQAERYNYVRLPLIILSLPLVFPDRQSCRLNWPRAAKVDQPGSVLTFSIDSSTLFALIIAACAATASVSVL